MCEIQRLVSIGFPLSEAVSLAHSMKKRGEFEAFVAQQEREYAASIIREAEKDGVFAL